MRDDIGFTEDEINDLIATATFGVEVEVFINGPMGKYLIAKANIEMQEAVEEMANVDPDNASEVRRVLDKLNTPRKVVEWLNTVVEEGRASHETLKSLEENQ